MTDRMKRTDADKLQNEYEKLVQGLATANEHREDEDMMSSPGKLSHRV
jgi:DNA excision repair protein ERCC-2